MRIAAQGHPTCAGMDTSSIPYASREKAILRDVVTGFYLGVLRNLIGDGCDSHCYVLVVCGRHRGRRHWPARRAFAPLQLDQHLSTHHAGRL
jgi:hypothetical protein